MIEKIWDDLDYTKNAVIEASAGTGKTYTLEQIVKKLVVEKGYDVRSILLVTFTEKAAGELKERIRALLEGRAGAEHLDEATICTIHAFCREVLSDYPFESGMSMGMDIGGSDDALYRKAVHTVLSSEEFRTAYADKFARRMEYWNVDGDAEGVAEDAVGNLRRVAIAENLKEWEDAFAEAKQKASGLEDLIRSMPGWSSEGPGAYAIAHTANGTTFQSRGDSNAARLNFFSGLDENLKVVMDENAAPSKMMAALEYICKGRMDFKLQKWDGVVINKKFCEHDGLKVYSEVQEVAGIKAKVLREEIIHEIVRRAYPEFLKLKARSSALTFDDLIKETARLVVAATSADADDGQRRFVDRMRARYQLALVDEFQDTDAKQWTIFKNLFARIGHLIVVGDPKQAIYGWRGADLATYLKAKREIIEGGGQYKTLDTMYRSTKEMVDDFNTMFQSGWFRDMAEDGLSIDYADVNFPKTNIPEKVAGFDYPAGEHAVEWLEAALGLEQFTINASDEMIRLHDTWGDRMAWDKMCVLTRSHDEGLTMQRQLVKKGIPCRIYKEPGIFASIEAESAVALFDYLSLPRSLGNLSALLLTPLFGYTPENIDERLTKGDARFDRLCESWRDYAERHDWIALFESVLTNTGARLAIAGYRQIFDYLLENNGRASSLAEFSEILRGLKKGDLNAGENGNIRNKSSEGAAVQIMTMHASKGLEYNAVFVASGFSGNATDGETKRLFYVALTRACYKLYIPWSENGISDDVAKRGSALRAYLKNAILSVCGDNVATRFRDPGERGIVSKERNDGITDSELPPHLGMKGWRFKWDSFSSLNHHSVEKPIVVDAAEDKDDESKDEAMVPVKTLVPKGHLSGTVFHEVMEILCNNDKDKSEVDFSIGAKDDFDQMLVETEGMKLSLLEIVRRRLKANGVANRMSEDGKESTARSLARMAWNALRTPLNFGGGEFRLCEIARKDRRAEVNFVLDEGQLLENVKDREGALNGSIDLLLCRGENYYIIDWKTNALESYGEGAVKAAMEHAGYHLQYKIYAMAAEKWLGGPVVKGAAYLFVRGGEYERNNSGRFVHPFTDEERKEFASTFAGRVAANDKDEDEEVK